MINVIKVAYIGQDSVSRELALIKVNTLPDTRNQIIEIVNIFRGKIVDIDKDSLTIEITGDEVKISGFLDLIRDFGIKEMVRTGTIAIERGAKAINY